MKGFVPPNAPATGTDVVGINVVGINVKSGVPRAPCFATSANVGFSAAGCLACVPKLKSKGFPPVSSGTCTLSSESTSFFFDFGPGDFGASAAVG
jgi:hypothetical protein